MMTKKKIMFLLFLFSVNANAQYVAYEHNSTLTNFHSNIEINFITEKIIYIDAVLKDIEVMRMNSVSKTTVSNLSGETINAYYNKNGLPDSIIKNNGSRVRAYGFPRERTVFSYNSRSLPVFIKNNFYYIKDSGKDSSNGGTDFPVGVTESFIQITYGPGLQMTVLKGIIEGREFTYEKRYSMKMLDFFRPAKIDVTHFEDILENTYTFEYNSDGNLTSITPAGKVFNDDGAVEYRIEKNSISSRWKSTHYSNMLFDDNRIAKFTEGDEEVFSSTDFYNYFSNGLLNFIDFDDFGVNKNKALYSYEYYSE